MVKKRLAQGLMGSLGDPSHIIEKKAFRQMKVLHPKQCSTFGAGHTVKKAFL